MITSLMTRSNSCAVEHLDRLGAAGAGDRFVIEVLERTDGRGADPRVVLDDQDPRAGHVRLGLGALDDGMDADRRRGALGARQIDRDRGAAADLAFDPDLAARLVGEPENLAEAEAGALADRLGGEEGLERAVEHLGLHPAAGVGDADPHIIAGANVADLVGGERHILGRDAHQAAGRPSRRAR